MANITKIYELTVKGHKDLVKNMGEVNASFESAKKRFEDLKKVLSTKGLNAFDFKTVSIEMQQAQLEMQKLKITNQQLTNEAKAYSLALKQQKDAEKTANGERTKTLSEYQKLSKELTILRNNAKEAGVVFGTNSTQFREAAQRANNLDKEIKKIDASLGQFQRNVGNYPKQINIGQISQGAFDSLKNSGLGDILGNELQRVRVRVQDLDNEFVELSSRLQQAKTAGVKDLESVEKAIVANRLEADKFNDEIQQTQTHLNGLGGLGGKIFGGISTDVKQMVLGFVGLQAAMSAVSSTMSNMKELSDQTTALEVELGKAAGGADDLVNSLKQIDTRTKLKDLTAIANIAVKAGVSEDNLVGVTGAIDKIKIAFGKDFGDVETGTESLVKLINVFEGEGQVTEQNLLTMGNAIRTLANESVASVPFINDFSKRMAGLKGISDISLPSVLGLASGFEQFGQSAEVSSTALVKIIPKLSNDTAKFAKIAGITNKEFKELINASPQEALLKVSEGLVKGKKGIEEISKSFADSELGSGRIASVLGVLGKNSDVFRKSIGLASVAYTDTSNITDAFAKKNENFAATLEKISKKFADLGSNQQLNSLFSTIAESILFVVKVLTAIPFSVVIGGITALTAVMLYNRGVAIQAGLATAWNNSQTLLGTLRNVAYRLGLISTATAMTGTATATTVATVATRGFNSALMANPLGIILALLSLLIPMFSAFGQSVDGSTKAIKNNNIALKTHAGIQREVTKEVSDSVGKQRASIDQLIRIIKDESSSLAVREVAYKKLVAQAPEFIGTLDAEFRATGRLTEVYGKYISKLSEVARAKSIAKAVEKAVDDETIAKQKEFIATKEKIEEDARQKKFKKDQANNKYASGYVELFADDDKALKSLEQAKKNTETATKNRILVEEFLNKQSDAVKKSVLENGVDDAGSSEPAKAYRGAKLNGTQKDYLKNLEAEKDIKLAINEKLYTQNKIDEKEYLKEIEKSTVEFYAKKIEYLKGNNAEERKENAQTKLALVKLEKETAEKIFDIDKNQAEKNLQQIKNDAQEKLNIVTANPQTDGVQRAEAELGFYETTLKAQVEFNSKMDSLEKDLTQKTNENAEKRKKEFLKIESDKNKSLIDLTKEKFKKITETINNNAEENANDVKLENERKKLAIYTNEKLTQKQKEIAVDKLAIEENKNTLQIEQKRIELLIRAYTIKLATKKLTEQEATELDGLILKLAEVNTEIAKGSKNPINLATPSTGQTQNFLKEKIAKSLGGDAQAELIGEVIGQGFDLATNAMNNYFESEKQAVERSKKLAYERIDIDKQNRLNTAQSQREREAIERDAIIKKEKADKEAGDKFKKIKKTELQITLATELANIAVAAASNPLNGATLGASGVVMYGILSALALARYAINVGAVNKAQYGNGGIYGRGGVLTGASHSENNGMPVVNTKTGEVQAYLEGGEGIVNKKSMSDGNVYNLNGTPAQIISKINASGGGVDFMGGATMTKYLNGGAYIGANVRPPSFFTQNNNGFDLNEIRQVLLETNETLNREVVRKTVINSREMSYSQKEFNKQTNIGTL